VDVCARMQAVCKAWRAVASDPQVRRAAFLHNWQLLGCHGMPRQLQFFEVSRQGPRGWRANRPCRLGLPSPVFVSLFAAADSSSDQLCS
jgi:hypothetical protein